MIFEKPSTRTRVSFEAGFSQLGGSSLFLSSNDLQTSRGETLQDTAKVVSSMVDVVAMRTNLQASLEEFAVHASCPVINALSDVSHPCQLLADLLTMIGSKDSQNLGDFKILWVGDTSNNMALTYIEAARIFGFELHLLSLEQYFPQASINQALKDNATIYCHEKLDQVAKNIDFIVTDTFVSMGDSNHNKAQELACFQVNHQMLANFSKAPKVMHCLPMHYGEEIEKSLAYSEHSLIWLEAENRLHVQKALVLFLLNLIP